MIKAIYSNPVKSVCFANIKKKYFDCLYHGCRKVVDYLSVRTTTDTDYRARTL